MSIDVGGLLARHRRRISSATSRSGFRLVDTAADLGGRALGKQCAFWVAQRFSVAIMRHARGGFSRRDHDSRYRVGSAARAPFRAIECTSILARPKTAAPATTSATRIVKFMLPPA